MFGLELDEARALAVGIREDGTVRRARGLEAGGDLAAAATNALRDVQSAMTGEAPGRLGVAAINSRVGGGRRRSSRSLR